MFSMSDFFGCVELDDPPQFTSKCEPVGMVYVVSRSPDEANNEAEICGIYTDKAAAERACKDWRYCVCPTPLNVDVTTGRTHSTAYFPCEADLC